MANSLIVVNNCLLCLKFNEKLIHIVDGDSFKSTIPKVLLKHLWFETEQNILGNFICTHCWYIVNSFHKFYEETLQVHKTFLSKTSDVLLSSENRENCGVEIKLESNEEETGLKSESKTNFHINREVKLKYEKQKFNRSTEVECEPRSIVHQAKFILTDTEKFVASSYFCDCGKGFSTHSLLKSHKRRVHEGVKESCEICAKTVKHLDAHKRYAHYDEPAIQRKHNYSRKIQSQSERIHQCIVCKATFRRGIDLREHLPTHPDAYLYKCSLCYKTFNSSANLNAHQNIIHPLEFSENRIKSISRNSNQNKDKKGSS